MGSSAKGQDLEFLFHPRSVAIIEISADKFESVVLILPPLPGEAKAQLRTFIADAGNSLRNPIDIPQTFHAPRQLIEALRILAECPEYDILVFLIYSEMYPIIMQQELCSGITDLLVEARKLTSKPMAVVLYPGTTSLEAFTLALEGRQKLASAGFLSYPSISRATNAISKFIQYHQERRK